MSVSPFRVGYGYDVHALVPDTDLWLGGVRIDYHLGLQGHSDADVLIHALCDALLGAASMGDIGRHFPPSDPVYRGVDSKLLLRQVCSLLADKGYTIGNVDTTVVAERPKLFPYILEMCSCLAQEMGISVDRVSVKATTTERLGFTGRQEGIAAHAVVLIYSSLQ